MAKKQLDTKTSDRIASILKEIDAKSVNTSAISFSSPFKEKAQATVENPKGLLDHQRSWHRTALLLLVGLLSFLSFIALIGIVLLQMYLRVENPEYNGVSDTVISILTTGVFAELIGVVAVITREVWKDPS